MMPLTLMLLNQARREGTGSSEKVAALHALTIDQPKLSTAQMDKSYKAAAGLLAMARSHMAQSPC